MKPVPRSTACQNCAFWRRLEKEHREWGECHGNPPGVGLVDGLWESNFPLMQQMDLCGRHKFREIHTAEQIMELEAARRYLKEFDENGLKKSA